MNPRVPLFVFLITGALAIVGCRNAHLAEDQGKATRAALAAQAKSDADGPAFTAKDALRARQVHYYGNRSPATVSAPMSALITGGIGSMGRAPGSRASAPATTSSDAAAGDGIRLRAK